jgi:deoxyribodipyrimidine photolyase-related protein
MRNYYDFLKNKKFEVYYINSYDENSDIRKFIKNQDSKEVELIKCIDPEDNYLERRLKESCEKQNINIEFYNNPAFINSKDDLATFFRKDKKKLFQTSFYKSERVRLNILLENNQKPAGGKWTYDDLNREKYPKNKKTPKIKFSRKTKNHEEAIEYVNKYYATNNGELNEEFIYPTDFETAEIWLKQFLNVRFDEFGPYEDAVLKEKSIINHSILSPLMNSGLISPKFVVDKTIEYFYSNNIRINSCEGFIRQVIGWREFIRGVYICKGVEERTKNFWGFKRKIPISFYNGTTGIEPVDDTIKKINHTAYANHIERLMIIGNFMLLCEFDPDEVYRWYMELFIDSYDWVMVPNVYGMSQFADGGLMSTKPYISSSNYILKMSNYKKGDWCKIWDALFWNFMDKQREFFLKNPRMRMLISSFDKMDISKRETHLITADNFLKTL